MSKVTEIMSRLRTRGTIELQEQALLGIIRKNENEILDANTEQLFKGELSTGAEIKPPYSFLTQQIKEYKNQPTDRVTLKDEGEFYQKFTLIADKFPVLFDSNSFKTPKLTEKYGDDIFGLNQKNVDELVQTIKPEVQAFYASLVRL